MKALRCLILKRKTVLTLLYLLFNSHTNLSILYQIFVLLTKQKKNLKILKLYFFRFSA